MKPPLRIVLLLFILPAALAHGQYAQYVDPFLGVAGGGNVFPGP